MHKKFDICVVTSTRADFGLLKPLVSKLMVHPTFRLRIAATGTHLSKEFGSTIDEIKNTFPNAAIDEIPIFKRNKTNLYQAADAVVAFEKYFLKTAPELVFVLGDRFEIFAISFAAYALKIPIAHISGGETTAGALDEAYRHSITKMSYLHFASCELYRNRIIAMGEEPSRVFNVGAIGLDNIYNQVLPTAKSVLENLGIPSTLPYVLLTFHPATIEDATYNYQIKEVFKFLDTLIDTNIIITKANADQGGVEINKQIDNYCGKNKNAFAFTSLGIVNYLALMKSCLAVIGNSSSGITEAPAFRVPTIDIGDRQKGRFACGSIVKCECESDEIAKAFERIQEKSFREALRKVKNPYGNGDASEKIVKILEDFLLNNKVNLKKTFYDR